MHTLFKPTTLLALVFSLLLPLSTMAQEAAEPTAEDVATYQAWMAQTLASLSPQKGTIELPNGIAILEVPEAFYYLSPENADLVLTQIWGNPPSEKTLGMIFPEGTTPFDDASWGVTIEYVADGYVDDKDAGDIDYQAMLESMQKDTEAGNEYRTAEGYEAIHLRGWAKQPYYDSSEKKLYWAKELQFGDTSEHTLNYNIRVLGRKGYLLLNFIASMEQLPEIESNLPEILALAEFKEGHRYADFDPAIDEVAAYGLGALVAGKVIAKTGLIATLLLLLKKFGVVIVIALGGAVKWLFKRGK